MKTLKHYFAAMIMLMISFGALAGPNVKDVESAMRSQNWSGAEQMLSQVLQKKPNSAKAHYLMAQTHEQMGMKSLAAQDLERAKSSDPSMKFASPGAVSRMEKRLNSQTSQYADQPVRKQAREQTYSPPAVINNPVAQTQSTPTAVKASSNSSGGGFGTFLMIVLVLAAIGGGAYFLFQYFQKKDRAKAATEQADAQRRALLSRAVDLQTRTTELQKTLRYESQEDSKLGLFVSSLVSNATSALSRLKGTTTDAFNFRSEESKLNSLESDLHTAERRLAEKDFDGAKEAASAKKRQEEVAEAERRTAKLRAEREREEEIRRTAQAQQDAIDAARRDREYQERQRNAPRHTEYQPQQQHHHHHHGSSGAGDLLTGVLIGSAIGGLSGSASAHNKSNDDGWGSNSSPAYEAPPPPDRDDPPALDFGGSNSWDNDSDSKSDTSSGSGDDDDDGFD
jgi:hypothetical protein